MYTSVHWCTLVYTGIHQCIPVYIGIHWYTPVYTSVHWLYPYNEVYMTCVYWWIPLLWGVKMIRYYNKGLWHDARHTTVQLPLVVVIIPCCVYLYISIQHNSCLGNSGSPYLRRISSALLFLSARLWQAYTVLWFHVLCVHCSPLSRSFSESPHFTSIHLLMLPPFPIVK